MACKLPSEELNEIIKGLEAKYSGDELDAAITEIKQWYNEERSKDMDESIASEISEVTEKNERAKSKYDEAKTDAAESEETRTATKKTLKFKARLLTDSEKIDTVLDGKIETTNTGKKGDYVITGLKGEEWIVPSSKFNDRYNILNNKDNIFEIETK